MDEITVIIASFFVGAVVLGAPAGLFVGYLMFGLHN